MDQQAENLSVLHKVISAFNDLGVPCAVGGSISSSVYGTPRFTRDADITVAPFGGREPELLTFFGPEYYISLAAAVEANRTRRCFNIIQSTQGFKVDVFVRSERAFDIAAMQRRTVIDVAEFHFPMFSPEDIVLWKLEWFRIGNEVSERQWSDILGVLRARADKLDQNYLEHWAATLQVSDLLQRANREAAQQ